MGGRLKMVYLDGRQVAVICMNNQCDYKGYESAHRLPMLPKKIVCPNCGFKTLGDARFYEPIGEFDIEKELEIAINKRKNINEKV